MNNTDDDVGLWRFCPACARPVSETCVMGWTPEQQQIKKAEIGNYTDDPTEEIECSGRERPWVYCPCQPQG